MVDLDRHLIIDMVEGNGATDLRRWLAAADGEWMAAIRVVATDLAESGRDSTADALKPGCPDSPSLNRT